MKPTNDRVKALSAGYRTRGMEHCAPYWDRARENHSFARGGEGQWDSDDLSRLKKLGMPRVSISQIPLILRSLAGRQILSRFERQYVPRTQRHAAWAEAMTLIDRAIMDRCDAWQEESTLFRNGSGIQGVGWARMRLDQLEDHRGKIVIEHVPVWNMLWPKGCEKVNLVDRPWHMHGSWWPVDELLATHSGAPVDNVGAPWENHIHNVGFGIRYIPATSLPGRGEAAGEQVGGMHWVETIEWYEVADRILLDAGILAAFTRETGIATSDTVSPEVFKDVRAWYKDSTKQEIPRAMWRETQRRVYYVAQVLGDEVLLVEESPVQCWTFEALSGYQSFIGDEWRFEGMVEQLKDRQRLENATFSSMLRMLQSNPKGALMYEDGFFRSPSEAMAQWAAPGGVIRVNRGKLTSGAEPFRHLGGINMPSFSMAQAIMEIAKNSVTEGAGFNPGALGQLGSDLRRISGTVTSFVNEAATAANSEIFDAFSLYRRRMGRTLLSFLSTYYEPKDLVDIIGEEVAYEFDPTTGQPMIDPATGEPVLRIPPKEMWKAEAWKSIAVMEAVPSPDRMRALWESLAESGGLQILVQMGLLDAELVAEMLPGVPEPLRDKMIARAKALVMQQQAPPEQGQEEETQDV